MHRPFSITALCWFQILCTILALASIPFSYFSPDIAQEVEKRLLNSPLPASLNLIVFFFSSYFAIYASILMLKGKALGRKITVILLLLSLILDLIERNNMTTTIGITLLSLCILFSPDANAYFSQNRAPQSP